MKDAIFFLDQESGKVLRCAEALQNAVTHLRYEGRLFREKNVKAVKAHIKSLKLCLKSHCGLQEKVIFPYLLTHIPKHELSIHFLQTDHTQIAKGEMEVEGCIKKLSKPDSVQKDTRVHEAGISLICLVRHHLEFEKRSIHKALRYELAPEEKREIRGRMLKWLKKRKSETLLMR